MSLSIMWQLVKQVKVLICVINLVYLLLLNIDVQLSNNNNYTTSSTSSNNQSPSTTTNKQTNKRTNHTLKSFLIK